MDNRATRRAFPPMAGSVGMMLHAAGQGFSARYHVFVWTLVQCHDPAARIAEEANAAPPRFLL